MGETDLFGLPHRHVWGKNVRMELRTHVDLGEFWDVAKAFYLTDPAAHTIALAALVPRLGTAHRGDLGSLITVHEQGAVTGAVFRSPPYPLVLSGLPMPAVRAVAAETRELEPDLPSVNGPTAVAEAFAGAWQELTGAPWRVERGERLYRLGTLVPPSVRGVARLARAQDMKLLSLWRKDFFADVLGKDFDLPASEEGLRQALEMGTTVLVWEVDGQPVSCAQATPAVAGMSRVSFVYTPPEQRGNGYASGVTAAMSRWALDAGADCVVLFTVIDNPVSNAIYQRIGYQPVHDTANVLLGQGN
ncbi:GNAT family N-acetyltransferase [Allokutzneria sp. A3M-2-11 16]|uniref:GNAT family N-acetyltransferase n=1 Tax=Allokutzneria sp. A3M-2-11 16 TaxID=2962043 RepID=UPI0020B6482B|nr:GNAT family N-acetyltransferase [Allokutzneria sp. A3M-2-11 16]MCP3801895.1 GNAT family N-acetyltransferase [Allokutzneria sp. A3M-2-11 16]